MLTRLVHSMLRSGGQHHPIQDASVTHASSPFWSDLISPLCVSPSGGALQMACSCLEPDYSIPTLLLHGQQGLLSCAVPRVPAAASWYCQAHFSTSSVRHHLWFSGCGTLVYSCSASTRHWTAANVGLILMQRPLSSLRHRMCSIVTRGENQ